MNWQTNLYFSSILLTCILTGFLAWYAWRQPHVTGSRSYAYMVLAESLLALTEIGVMLVGTEPQAAFWFSLRVPFAAIIPVFWLFFALEYSGRGDWLSKLLRVALFAIPIITQVVMVTSSLHGLWLVQDVAFEKIGPFWIADTSARIPSLWYLVHTFYSTLLLVVGAGALVVAAWRKPKRLLGQALLVSLGALTALGLALTGVFNLLPELRFNPFVPGIGFSAVCYALAIFRFQFLKRPLPPESGSRLTDLKPEEKGSLAVLILIFILFVSGIAAASYLTYQNYEKQFRAQVGSQLESIASLKADELREWRTERLADANLFYRNKNFSERVQDYLENPQDADAQAKLPVSLEKIMVFPGYDRVFLLDTEGVEQFSIPATPDPDAVPAALIEWAAECLASDEIIFLDFHRHSDAGPVHLSLLVPVYAPQDNQPLGVLVLRIDPNVYLYPFLQRWPVPSESAETLLLRREGQEVVFLNALRFQPDAALELRFPLTETQIPAVKVALGETGVGEGLDYRGVEVIADTHPVPDSPWFLVSKMDASEVYAPLRERLQQTLIFFGALILACGAGLLLSWRQQQMRYYRAQAGITDALRASEEKFRMAFDTSPDSVAITRAKDGMFVSVNKGFEQITGYLREEVIGKTSLEINIWKDPEDRRKVVEGLKARGEVRNFEAPFLKRDGEIIGLMSAVIIELNGEPHILNITRDITERKQAEEALRESEEKFKYIFDNSVTGKSITQPSGEINANRAFCEMLGYSQEELKGGKWQEISHPDDLELTQNIAKSLLSGEKESVRFTKRYFHKNGSVVWADVGTALRRDKDGKPLYFMTSVSDITERKQAEDALRESRAILQAAMDNSPAGIAIADAPDGKLRYVNNAGLLIRGGDLQSIVDGIGIDQYVASWQMLDLDGRPLKSDEVPLARAILFGETNSREFIVRRASNDDRIVLGNAAPIMDERGKVTAGIVIFTDITERKQAEEALRESQEKFRIAQDMSPDGFTILRPVRDAQERVVDFTWIYENAAVARLNGTDPEAVVGRRLLELFPGHRGTPFLRAYQQVAESGETCIFESGYSGESMTNPTSFRIVVVPMAGDIAILAQDITERKRVENALRESEEEYRSLVQSIQVGVVVHAPDSSVLFSNSRASELLGQTPDQMRGKTAIDETWCFIREDETRMPLEEYPVNQALATLKPITNLILGILRPDQERPTWVQCNAHQDWDLNGNLQQVVVSFADITERKQANDALRERESLLNKIFDILPVGLWLADKNGNLTRSNKMGREIWGAEPLVGQEQYGVFKARRLPSGEELAPDDWALAHTIREGVTITDELLEIEAFDGRKKIILNYTAPVLNQAGGVDGAVIINLDITERIRAEQKLAQYSERLEEMVTERTRELREAQEQLVRQERLAALGQLAGSIGHELRNPLGVISNAVYFLKLSQPDAGEKIREYLDIIDSETRTSDKIVTDLLDFTRIKSLDRQPASVSELIHQTLERNPAPESVEIKLEIPADLPPIYVDPQHVIQVLGNLISNAFQSMVPESQRTNGRELTVSAVVESAMIKVDIQDMGSGIPLENMKKLFEPLFTTKIKGIGLGLAVSRKLIEANGGRIEVESEAGKGSTFSVYLPVYEESK